MDAIDAEKYKGMGDFELVDALSELSGVKVRRRSKRSVPHRFFTRM